MRALTAIPLQDAPRDDLPLSNGSAAAPAWSIPAALIAIGIWLRLSLYLANRSLWGDEASLAVNLVERSFRELCWPLDYEQGSPIGFLFAQKTIVKLLGGSEYALRLLPLISGIASLLLGWLIARRLFRPAIAWATLAMMVFSKSLVHYSAELKQYSSDTTVTLAIFLCAIVLHEKIHRKASGGRMLLLFTTIGVLGVWFSHPAVFVVAGVAAVLICDAWHFRDHRRAFGIAVSAGLSGISALIHYLYFARNLTKDHYLLRFWAEGMMPLQSVLGALLWLCRTLPKSFTGLFGSSGVVLSCALFIVGCLSLWHARKFALLCMLLTPALVTLSAAALHKYPYSDRLIVFLLPLAILLFGAGFDGVAGFLPPRWNRLAIMLLLLGILSEPVIVGVKASFAPPQKEDMKRVLAYLEMHVRPGDALYVFFRGRPAFEYYGPRYKLPKIEIYLGQAATGVAPIENELHRFTGRRRVWVLRTTPDDRAERNLLEALSHLGTPLTEQASAKGVRAGVYQLD